MARLLALFILIPLVELVLLVEIDKRIGLPATLGLIVATGALGAALARRQGLGVLAKLRDRPARNLLVSEILDGVIILVAGAVLITPGVLTDLFGFFCLLPAGRRSIKRLLERHFSRKFEFDAPFTKGPSREAPFDATPPGREPMRDVTPPEPPGD